MTFHVKARVIGQEWDVFYKIDAGSFNTAESNVKRMYAKQKGVPLGQVDVQAYRSDAKSVWKGK